MFRSVLVANRGEIARRVIRACHAVGARAIAVYSEADAGAPHVRDADQAVPIGPAPARESYLNGPRIVEAARQTGAEAVHPGYGFLAEDWRFAGACAEAGLVFVGPSPEAIRRMGDKTEARRAMTAAGLPVVPGADEPSKDATAAERIAHEIGYPVMLKAAHGGGGIGIARVESPEAMARAWAAAERRVQAAFGQASLYVERCLPAPRHVEVQIFGDATGQVVHLHERDCSIQRRHQKLVEEAPAPGLPPTTTNGLTAAAVRGARALGYVNAGTMEFLVDQDGSFYFLEMNTRLQVEHAVTEEVTGLDLVAAQLRVAAGEALPWRQEAIRRRGVAIEGRIYAEDPARGFLPSPGTITTLAWPSLPGVRVEAGVAPGSAVTVHYDPLLAKVIARGDTRQAAIERLSEALAATQVEGVKTTVPFLRRVLASPAFRAGRVHTQMAEQGAFGDA